MKIIYCLENLAYSGGIERVISERASYMADRWGYEIILVTTEQGAEPCFYPLSPKVRTIDLEINYAEVKSSSWLLSRIRFLQKRKIHRERLTNLVSHEKPDVLVSTFNSPERSFLPKLKDGSRKVGELHLSLELETASTQYAQSHLLQKMLIRIRQFCFISLLKKYDRIVVISRTDYYRLAEKRIQVSYIPNPLSWEATEKRQTVSEKRILSVGRMDYLKGHDRLIDVWKHIEPDYPDWTLHIYGGGSPEWLQKQITEKKLRRIAIHAPQKGIQAEYERSSVFISGSRSEGFSMVILEALSVGLPVVCFDCETGPRDLVSSYYNGFLVPDGDADAFVSSLRRLMDDEARRELYGRNALCKASEFRVERVMEMWKNIWA